EYRLWCSQNNFVSMIKDDVEARKAQAATQQDQQTLDSHIRSTPRSSVITYSDESFKELAVKWLVRTDQPLSALEHPAFVDMIEMAAKA
ncbi:hypothetical protein GLOTRDRAFT_24866, partial [Gloeophyllum trabeum ATCC 11539]